MTEHLGSFHHICHRSADAGCMLQVGQELEDVLTERDALKAVNKELAKRVTTPGSPCARCQQARQLLLQSASWRNKSPKLMPIHKSESQAMKRHSDRVSLIAANQLIAVGCVKESFTLLLHRHRI